ncbi:actin patches distal protein [Whalleya microplaca]|nr:actin patches distal protein [Whalleya microplaca]
MPSGSSSSHHRHGSKHGMASGLMSFFGGARRAVAGDPSGSGGSSKRSGGGGLFPQTTPDVDGEACTRDCDSCTVKYPRHFKVEESHALYGRVKPWSTHVLVATSKSDWSRKVEDERGSVMEAFDSASKPSNGKLMLSASNMPTPSNTTDYSEPTTVLVLPAFTIVSNVTPGAVPTLISKYISRAPTTGDPLASISLPATLPAHRPGAREMVARACPHRALVLLCSHRTRDARCGQSAPLIRKELERHLRPLGLDRDLDDERPGGVGIYFVNHVGGHKYSANMLIYRRPNAFGIDDVDRGSLAQGEELKIKDPVAQKAAPVEGEGEGDGEGNEDLQAEIEDVGAGQCIWLARVRPEDCENLVRYTILQGRVVKRDSQLRGGFDRSKGLASW